MVWAEIFGNVKVYKSVSFKINQQGMWSGLDSESFHRHDPQLAEQIVAFFKSKNASSVLDLGAGLGLYTEKLIQNGKTGIFEPPQENLNRAHMIWTFLND